MSESTTVSRVESRWQPALIIALVAIVLHVLPPRLRSVPLWVAYLAVGAMVAAMVAVSLGGGRPRWLRLELIATVCFLILLGVGMLRTLDDLVGTIVYHPSAIGAIPLLSSSVAVWLTNVLLFALVYWRIDRGGPEARANSVESEPDWLFPQMERKKDWRPSFVDYLFLAFSTSTAFSPADTVPLTGRAKILMMAETSIGLVIIVVVAARAISVLT